MKMITMGDVVRDMTLNVEVVGVRACRVRLWLGCQFIRLAARIIGCGIVIDVRENP